MSNMENIESYISDLKQELTELIEQGETFLHESEKFVEKHDKNKNLISKVFKNDKELQELQARADKLFSKFN